MIILVFVHGTGVRKKGVRRYSRRDPRAGRPQAGRARRRVPLGRGPRLPTLCWGCLGADLRRHARPRQSAHAPAGRGSPVGTAAPRSLGELRLLAVREGERKKLPLGGSPSDRLAAQVAVFARSGSIVGPLRGSLADAGLLDVFDEARRVVLTSDRCEDAIASAVEPFDEERFVYRFSSNSASMTSSVWPASGHPFGEAEGPFLAAPSPGDAAAA
jgi:hypothetical protein